MCGDLAWRAGVESGGDLVSKDGEHAVWVGQAAGQLVMAGQSGSPVTAVIRLAVTGGALLEAIGPLVAWTRAHRDDVAAAQAVYDAESRDSFTPARPSPPR